MQHLVTQQCQHLKPIQLNGSQIQHKTASALLTILMIIWKKTWDRVKEATLHDPHLQQLIKFITSGFPVSSNELPPQLQQYWRYHNDLYVVENVILMGSRIVIQPTLHTEICKILHSAHQGTTAMTERAKATVFWPSISSSINQTREQCNSCWAMALSQPYLPPIE